MKNIFGFIKELFIRNKILFALISLLVFRLIFNFDKFITLRELEQISAGFNIIDYCSKYFLFHGYFPIVTLINSILLYISNHNIYFLKQFIYKLPFLLYLPVFINFCEKFSKKYEFKTLALILFLSNAVIFASYDSLSIYFWLLIIITLHFNFVYDFIKEGKSGLRVLFSSVIMFFAHPLTLVYSISSFLLLYKYKKIKLKKYFNPKYLVLPLVLLLFYFVFLAKHLLGNQSQANMMVLYFKTIAHQNVLGFIIFYLKTIARNLLMLLLGHYFVNNIYLLGFSLIFIIFLKKYDSFKDKFIKDYLNYLMLFWLILIFVLQTMHYYRKLDADSLTVYILSFMPFFIMLLLNVLIKFKKYFKYSLVFILVVFNLFFGYQLRKNYLNYDFIKFQFNKYQHSNRLVIIEPVFILYDYYRIAGQSFPLPNPQLAPLDFRKNYLLMLVQYSEYGAPLFDLEKIKKYYYFIFSKYNYSIIELAKYSDYQIILFNKINI